MPNDKVQMSNLKVTSKNVIPAKAGIQNVLKSLDSCFRRSDEFGIIRGSVKFSNIGNSRFCAFV
jgi:hypothetical protein